jgi:hypothetical protein
MEFTKGCRHIIEDTKAYWKYYLEKLMETDTVAKRLYDKYYSNEPLTSEPRVLHRKLRQDLDEIQRNIENGSFTTSTINIDESFEQYVTYYQHHFGVARFCTLHEDGDKVFVVICDVPGSWTLKLFSLTVAEDRSSRLTETGSIPVGDYDSLNFSVGSFGQYVAICDYLGRVAVYNWVDWQKVRTQNLDLDPYFPDFLYMTLKNCHLIFVLFDRQANKVKTLVWNFKEGGFQTTATIIFPGRHFVDAEQRNYHSFVDVDVQGNVLAVALPSLMYIYDLKSESIREISLRESSTARPYGKGYPRTP